jgi:hypothetical protein
MDSRKNFYSVVNAIDESLKKIRAEFDAEHHTISSVVDRVIPSHQCPQRIDIGRDFSHDSGYVEPKFFTWYVWSEHGLTRATWMGDNSIEFSLRCTRPCSIISRQPNILLVIHPAKENQLVLDRLKTKLNELGLSYEITEEKSPYY